VANLQISTTAATVHVDGRASTDADADALIYTIDFGDGTTITNPHAWHSYLVAGDYTVTLKVSDGGAAVSKAQTINVQPSTGNQPPIAMLTAVRQRNALSAYATASFDPEGTPLTYEWEFANGPTYIGDASTSYVDCAPGEKEAHSHSVAVTVSDGELKDTRQVFASGDCTYVIDLVPAPQFSYRVEGNKVFVDGRDSINTTRLSWNFGDDSPEVTGLLAEHSYAAPGTYNIELFANGPSLFVNRISQSVVVDFALSSRSSSSFSAPSSASRSSTSSLGLSSLSSSSVAVISSSRSSSSIAQSSSSVADRNLYTARKAQVAPVIDGTVDAVWEQASWAPINVFWLGTQANPSAADYTGRYKALWDANYLYLLFDVTDDRIYDRTRDALSNYWEDDTVELFIDENKNGGQHSYNTSAWAYHVSTYGDVVDYTTSGPKLLNDHIDVRLVSLGDKHVWELRVRIYGEDYADWKTNTPLTLTAGKLMGFSASYIDNDGSAQRESMMGSVDTAGHKNNQGYLDASVFGSLKLVE